MKYIWLVLAAIPLILIPFLGVTWLNFSIFCLLLYYREPLSKWYHKVRVSREIKFILFFLLFGYLVEILAIVDNLPLPPAERILLHPNPIVDLYLATGYYLGFAIAWFMVGRSYKFTILEIFLLGGFFGILFEQMGKVFFSFNPFAWLYVFLVYGSFQASAPLLAREELFIGKELSLWKKVLLGVITEVLAFILAGLLLWFLSTVAGLS